MQIVSQAQNVSLNHVKRSLVPSALPRRDEMFVQKTEFLTQARWLFSRRRLCFHKGLRLASATIHKQNNCAHQNTTGVTSRCGWDTAPSFSHWSPLPASEQQGLCGRNNQDRFLSCLSDTVGQSDKNVSTQSRQVPYPERLG